MERESSRPIQPYLFQEFCACLGERHRFLAVVFLRLRVRAGRAVAEVFFPARLSLAAGLRLFAGVREAVGFAFAFAPSFAGFNVALV